MTVAERKTALARVRKLANDARRLAAYDGHASPPDWRPFVAELADEVVKILEQPQSKRKTR